MAVATDTGNVYIGVTAGTVHVNPPTGIAEKADKLTTPRAFSATGDATAPAVNFDGTAPVALALTLANSGVAAGTYTKITVDAKGRVTNGTQVTLSDVSGAGTAAGKNTGTAAGNVVIVESDGKISPSIIPSIAITDVFVVASQVAMLALSNAEPGDLAVRTDVNRSYILKALPYSTLSNWVELLSPPGEVISVNGKTGAVTLTKADVGLGNADNTADSAKNVMSATKLTTARTIALSGGATGTATNFDGTVPITIPVTALDASKLTGNVDGGTF